MKKQNFWRRLTASFLLSIMVLTSSSATVFAEDILDLSDPGIITEVGEITDLTDEDIEFLPSGEDDLPEISETPGQPEIPDPEPAEPETQPEFDPEARILAAMLDTGAREIQQITRAGNPADYDPLGVHLLPCLSAGRSKLGHRHHRR